MARIISYLILFILTFLTNYVFAQDSYSKLDKFFENKLAKADMAGLQAAIISKGELKWIGSYGKSDYLKNTSVNDSTLFMIASCSKPLTALGLMKLYDDGLIDLNDDINDYLPFKIVNPNIPRNLSRLECYWPMPHLFGTIHRYWFRSIHSKTAGTRQSC